VIQKDMGLIPLFNYLPLLSGVLLAISQFIPEMQNKRLKLTLHLPLPESGIMAAMLFFGWSIVFLLFAVTLIVLLAGLHFYFAGEIVSAAFQSALPWFMAGITGYLVAAWVCLEPVWRLRIFNTAAGLCALSLFFIKAKSGAYVCFIPVLIVFMLICFSFPFFSTARFKEGAQ
jgi:hypothetical protein